jgi:hypothetical protein
MVFHNLQESRMSLGKKHWAIAEGYIPSSSTGPGREWESHETVCVLNTNDQPAEIEIMIYFSDKDPTGPYKETIEGRRTKHIRFNDLNSPAPVPKGIDFASTITSNIPIIVQHTRLDSRQAENALLSTIAYSQ